MSAMQLELDLFGNAAEKEALSAAEKARHAADQAAWDNPATCPSCGREEPSGFLLSLNHGYNPVTLRIAHFPQFEHPIYGRHCTAQVLTINHITYAVLHDSPEDLQRYVDRGRQVGLDVEEIVAEARATPSTVAFTCEGCGAAVEALSTVHVSTLKCPSCGAGAPHREVERFTLPHFPPDSPHRVRVRCACGHTPSVVRWDTHLELNRRAA